MSTSDSSRIGSVSTQATSEAFVSGKASQSVDDSLQNRAGLPARTAEAESKQQWESKASRGLTAKVKITCQT